MERLLAIGISNALAAGVLALVALAAARLLRRPAVTHALWLLVLVKLLTPPLVVLPIFPAPAKQPAPAAAALRAEHDLLPPMEPQIGYGDIVAPAEQLVPLEESPPLFAEPLLEPIDGPRWRLDTPEPPAIDLADDAVAAQSAPFDGTSAETLTSPTSLRSSSPRFDPRTWIQVATALWAGGSLLWCAVALARIVRFKRLLRYAKPAPPAIQQTARALAARIGLRSCPVIELVPGSLAPLVWFMGRRPRLLLAARLLERLDAQQAAGLVAHELAHLRRRDHWVRLIELAATALYWWNPVLWWARRELREAEEQCCDAWAIWALRDSARTYAETLLTTVELLSNAPLALPPLSSGLAHQRVLRRRLTMIMQRNTRRCLSPAARLLVLLAALLALPLVPGRAQSVAQVPEQSVAPPPPAVGDRTDAQATPADDLADATPGEGVSDTQADEAADAFDPLVSAADERLRLAQEQVKHIENLYRRGFTTKEQWLAAVRAVQQAAGELEKLKVVADVDARVAHAKAVAERHRALSNLEIAKAALEEYLHGTFPQEQTAAQAALTVAEQNRKRATENLKNVRNLHEKGFKTEEQVEAAEFNVTRADLEVRQAQTALDVLLKFTRPKMQREMEANIEQAEAELKIALIKLRQVETDLQPAPRPPRENRRDADAPGVSAAPPRPPDPLAKQRAEAAREAYEFSMVLFQEGQLSEIDQLYRWSVRWLNVERLAGGTEAEQRAALERHLGRMQALEDVATARWKAGLRGGSHLDVVATRYYRLEAQSWLSQHGGDKSPGGAQSRQSPSEESPDQTRWGDLRGRFVVEGPIPQREPLRVTKDAAVFGDTLPDESLIINPVNGGLANVIVFLRTADDAPVPIHPSYEAAAAADVTLRVTSGRYEPRVVLLRSGQRLLVENLDPVAHNVNFVSFANPLIPRGKSYTGSFTRPRRLPIPITNNIYAWMRGWLMVSEHPYAAVTDADGTFEIRNLPAGRWTFRAWHEELGYVGPDRGRFALQIGPGVRDLGEIKAAASAVESRR